MFQNDEFVLELLQNYGMATADQVEEARSAVNYDEQLVLDELVRRQVTDEEAIMHLMASEYAMEAYDLEGFEIPDEIKELIPDELAVKHQVVPIMANELAVTVAMADPTNLDTLDQLRYSLSFDLEGVLAKRSQVLALVGRYYGQNKIGQGGDEEFDIETIDSELIDELDQNSDDGAIERYVNQIIVRAYEMKASDIHMEPLETKFRVRYRMDGVLREVENPPKYLQNNIIARLKLSAGLKITEKRVPQDGRIALKVKGKPIDLRVSTVPTTHGESIVMRILDKSSISIGIPELGFFSDDQEIIDRVISMPDGIFLVTGPTGSGKTTSLYAFLNSINEPTRKIITAEDPVEYDLAGINQVQVDNSIGMTFAGALRSMLRQAPNVIMVGEIRDMETGAVAINAALTGHVVFSTLHTNDAPGAVTRMVDMGVQPFLVAASLRAVMAQRLVRKICKECAEPYEATAEELRILGLPEGYFDNATLMKGKGCPACNGGYKGRMGIFELFEMNDSIRELIYRKASSAEIKKVARDVGMRTLREDALRKCGAGLTTLEEVIRFTVVDEEGM